MGLVAFFLMFGVFLGLGLLVILCFWLFLIIHCLRLNLDGKEKRSIIFKIIFNWPETIYSYCRDYLKVPVWKVKIFLNILLAICALIAWGVGKKYFDKAGVQHTVKVETWKKLL